MLAAPATLPPPAGLLLVVVTTLGLRAISLIDNSRGGVMYRATKEAATKTHMASRVELDTRCLGALRWASAVARPQPRPWPQPRLASGAS